MHLPSFVPTRKLCIITCFLPSDLHGLYHECHRTIQDRLLMAHDVRWFTETLESVCRKHFWVVEELEQFKGNRKVGEDGNLEEGEIDAQRVQ